MGRVFLKACIGDATELEVSSTQGDGTLRAFVTIWGVRVGDAIYVRSAHGSGNGWFRRAKSSGRAAGSAPPASSGTSRSSSRARL